MPKEEWGVKRICPNCSTRFYDLKRDPMTCPACDHSMTLDSIVSGKGRTLMADKSDAKSVPEPKTETAADTADEVLEDDTAADVDLGDDVLEDDDDDDTDVPLEEIADVATNKDET